MNIRILSCSFAFFILCFCVADLQARLAVVLQQKEAVVSIMKSDGRMMTGDFETFVLADENVSAKASRLQGQKAHLLYYVNNEEKICVDLRPAVEPSFKITDHPRRGNSRDGKRLY